VSPTRVLSMHHGKGAVMKRSRQEPFFQMKIALHLIVISFFVGLAARLWYFHQHNERMSKATHHLYDKNRNMRLEVAELLPFLKDHGIELTESQRKMWVDQVDDEGDGFDESETHEVFRLFDELPSASSSLKSISSWSSTRDQIFLDLVLLALTGVLCSVLLSQSEHIYKAMSESSWGTSIFLWRLRRRGASLSDQTEQIKKRKFSLHDRQLSRGSYEKQLSSLLAEDEKAKANLSSWRMESQTYFENAGRLRTQLDKASSWFQSSSGSNQEEKFEQFGFFQERSIFGGIEGGGGFYNLNRDASLFGNVCNVCEDESGRKYIVRLFDLPFDADKEKAERDGAEVLESLKERQMKLASQENVKVYFKIVVTSQIMFILYKDFFVSDILPTDLGYVIDARGFPLSEKEGRVVFSKIIDALHTFHSQDISYGFLSLESIGIFNTLPHEYIDLCQLCSPDKHGGTTIGLIEFGTACFYDLDMIPSNALRGDDFMAPEDLGGDGQKARLTKARDLWRLGGILYTALTGELPFSQDCFIDGKWRRSMDVTRVSKGLLATNERFEALSMNFRDLIHGLLRFNPDERLTIESIKEHPWFSMKDEELPEVS